MSALLPTYARSELSFARGEGAYLYTTTGERYLDFASGVAVTALGHAHPHLVKALTEQAKKLWHVSNLHQIPEQARLAEHRQHQPGDEWLLMSFGNGRPRRLEQMAVRNT